MAITDARNRVHTRGKQRTILSVTFAAALCSGLVSAPSGSSFAATSDLPACLLGQWMHSHEEDLVTVSIYRPPEYPFPPSRGRTGFAFLPDGELISYGIAPADGVLASHGTWIFIPPSSVRIDLESAETPPVTLDAVSCSDERLEIATA